MSGCTRPSGATAVKPATDKQAKVALAYSLTLTLTLTLALACAGGDVHRGAEQSRPPTPARTEIQAEMAAYPPGRWRLATHHDLDRTLLWVSQILIEHRGSHESATGRFGAFGWLPTRPISRDRSRREALQLATQISARLTKDPDQFEKLAAVYSDDLATADRGGSLGGVRASMLGPRLLDAIEATPLDEITSVIETSLGFHILRHRAPPAEELISGRRLVIRYDQSINWELYGKTERTRTQAFDLAESLAHSEADFENVVRSFSEHPDRDRGGDLGTWSSLEPEYNGRELEQLQSLRVGQLSPALDSPVGIEILQRTSAGASRSLAIEIVQFSYDPTRPPQDPQSRASVKRQAQLAALQAQSDPKAFRALQRQYCCNNYVRRFRVNTDSTELEAVVDALATGEIAKAPVDVGWFYLLPKRVADAPLHVEEALLYALPQPAAPDIDDVILFSGGHALAKEVGELEAWIESRAGDSIFDETERARLHSAMASLRSDLERAADSEERIAAKNQAIRKLHEGLSSEAFERFDTILKAWSAQRIIQRWD